MSRAGSSLPKPLCEAGGIPLIVHVLRHLRAEGNQRFIVALGHKQEVIRSYFDACPEPGLILADTGENTQTGGRLRRIKPMLGGGGDFLVCYSDTLADVDVPRLLAFHKKHGRLATMLVAPWQERYGQVQLAGDEVVAFEEKPRIWVNAGYFLLKEEVLDLVEDDATSWERDCLSRLARDQQLRAIPHEGFWMAVDTPEELARLDSLCREEALPWKERLNCGC